MSTISVPIQVFCGECHVEMECPVEEWQTFMCPKCKKGVQILTVDIEV